LLKCVVIKAEKRMTTTTIELNSAKRKLCSVLGERQKDYFGHMKSWFRKKITKEEFDVEARKLLSVEHGHLHNEFFLAILNKCQTLASFQPSPSTVGVAVGVAVTSGIAAAKTSPSSPAANREDHRLKVGAVNKRRSKSNRATFDHQFQPVALSGIAPDLDEQQLQHQDAAAATSSDSCEEINYNDDVRDGMMPDSSLIQGRMLVAAWEEGLEGGHTDPEVISLLCLAAEQQVRAIITALLMDKKGFKLMDAKVPHKIGLPASNPWLEGSKRRRHADGGIERSSDYVDTVTLPVNSTISDPPLVPAGKPTYDEAVHDALVEVACGSVDQDSFISEPLTLFDLMHTLQKHKKIIPSHSVYAVNMERLISRLYHKARDE